MQKITIAVVSLFLCVLFSKWVVFAEEANQNEDIFVEVFLSLDRKEGFDAIRKAFEGHSIRRVSAQFFRKGNPPRNIAIGSQIPAPIARLVIDLAIQYNQGVTHLLPQFRFFPHQIAIGTSAFDERVPVAILPEDLERLKDPKLSTPEFHRHYRMLTGEKIQ